jgi:hypothetical protein
MKYLIVIEETSTGYSAFSPDLEGCVATGSTRVRINPPFLKGDRGGFVIASVAAKQSKQFMPFYYTAGRSLRGYLQ